MPKLIQFDGTNLYCDGVPANVSNEIISSHDKNKIQSRPIILYGIGTIGLCVLNTQESRSQQSATPIKQNFILMEP